MGLRDNISSPFKALVIWLKCPVLHVDRFDKSGLHREPSKAQNALSHCGKDLRTLPKWESLLLPALEGVPWCARSSGWGCVEFRIWVWWESEVHRFSPEPCRLQLLKE